jgi:hypothetical protein
MPEPQSLLSRSRSVQLFSRDHLRNLQSYLITNSALHQGAVKTVIEGTKGNGVIINDNPGSLLIV